MGEKIKIILGRWSRTGIDALLSQASEIPDAGARIAFLSRHFLDTPYKESTLIGNPETAEELVLNLSGLDCFTFIDYVEAMRLAPSFTAFLERLKEIRYREGILSYWNRNHFFTDWREFNERFVSDITTVVGKERTRQSLKTLNRKSDGTLFLEGIPVHTRTLEYIPSAMIGSAVLDNLHVGDYIGIYTETDGLDVSHVGIIIMEKDKLYLRHASSAPTLRRVTDQFFGDYIREKPGVVVFRPRTV